MSSGRKFKKTSGGGNVRHIEVRRYSNLTCGIIYMGDNDVDKAMYLLSLEELLELAEVLLDIHEEVSNDQ